MLLMHLSFNLGGLDVVAILHVILSTRDLMPRALHYSCASDVRLLLLREGVCPHANHSGGHWWRKPREVAVDVRGVHAS
jgi:hypothetical protein